MIIVFSVIYNYMKPLVRLRTTRKSHETYNLVYNNKLNLSNY